MKKVGAVSGRDLLTASRLCEQSEAIHARNESAGLPRHFATRNDIAHDKFSEFGIETFAAQKIAAPLVKGCVAWLECKIIPEPHNQNIYDLFIAEVIAAQADERVFKDGRWHFEGNDQETLDKLRTIHHVAGGAFFATGQEF